MIPWRETNRQPLAPVNAASILVALVTVCTLRIKDMHATGVFHGLFKRSFETLQAIVFVDLFFFYWKFFA